MGTFFQVLDGYPQQGTFIDYFLDYIENLALGNTEKADSILLDINQLKGEITRESVRSTFKRQDNVIDLEEFRASPDSPLIDEMLREAFKDQDAA